MNTTKFASLVFSLVFSLGAFAPNPPAFAGDSCSSEATDVEQAFQRWSAAKRTHERKKTEETKNARKRAHDALIKAKRKLKACEKNN